MSPLVDNISAEAWEEIADFGTQPFTNRFAARGDEPEDGYHLRLGVSLVDGLIGQLSPPRVADVRARVAGVIYNEAEDHLDDLVMRLMALPGADPAASGLALTYKDDSTIRRLQERGFSRLRRLDMESDLGITAPYAGLETIQAELTPAWAAEYVSRHGPCSWVIARHIFEHTHDSRTFLETIKTLLAPGGYAVLEVPDSDTFLRSGDYTLPWEEHVWYFTPTTFVRRLRHEGLGTVFRHSYLYPLENSLVAVVQKTPCSSEDRPSPDATASLAGELAVARAYGRGWSARSQAIQAYLASHRARGGRVAMFGAGHAAAMYINLHRLAELIDQVVDDAPAKQGRFMPGSRLPILPSSSLLAGKITLCLLSVNHNTEPRVLARHQAYVDAGNVFFSIYQTSPRALPV